MPPANFRAAAALTFSASALHLLTPRAAAEGDTLLVIAAGPLAWTPTQPDGWELIVNLGPGSPSSRVAVWRRVVVHAEPSTHDFPTGASTNPIGLALLYRDLAPTAVIVDVEVNAMTSSVNTHVAPGVTVTSYSDVAFSIFLSLDSAATNAIPSPPPAPPIFQRGPIIHGNPVAGGGSLAVFEQIFEQTFVLTAIQQIDWQFAATGLGVRLVLAAEPTIPALTLPSDGVPGAIGLVTRGV